jgi:hypothetical protein
MGKMINDFRRQRVKKYTKLRKLSGITVEVTDGLLGFAVYLQN